MLDEQGGNDNPSSWMDFDLTNRDANSINATILMSIDLSSICAIILLSWENSNWCCRSEEKKIERHRLTISCIDRENVVIDMQWKKCEK